jgi:hypothetical protein
VETVLNRNPDDGSGRELAAWPFVCYYDTSEGRSIHYMGERAARFFYSEYTMT